MPALANKVYPNRPDTMLGNANKEFLKRDCFLYLDPKDPKDEFAQCNTCVMWVFRDKCTIHGPKIDVFGSMSCGLYVHGTPQPRGTATRAVVTPLESGLVDRDVRCENCRWGGPETYICAFFTMLNNIMPQVFKLDINIEPKACCNAQMPRP